MWQAKLLSRGGRLVLLLSILAENPIFHLSMYKLPIGVGKRLDGLLSHFLARLKIALTYSLSARWSSPCGPGRPWEESMPLQLLLSSARPARGLSEGRRSGRPFSPPYGRYVSTETRLFLGANSPPSMRYNMVRGG